MRSLSFALALALTPVSAFVACNNQVTTAATKPMSPAEGAADYKTAGGPHEKPVVPTGSSEPTAAAPPASGSASSVNAQQDCPPKCGKDGKWSGCGLEKPRGSKCEGCTPKCKGKGTIDEGWYDCSGVLIAQRACT